MQGTDIVQSVMGYSPLSTGSFVFIQFSVQTADRGFILETVRMKGIGVLRYRISDIELRYRFRLSVYLLYQSLFSTMRRPGPAFVLSHQAGGGFRCNVCVGAQKMALKIALGGIFVWILTKGCH